MMRRLLQVLAALTGAAALILAAMALSADRTNPMQPNGDVYNQSPTHASHHDDMRHDDMQQTEDGTWVSNLLPYAAPFPTKEALEQALAEARRQGLIR
jgi:hypothetical protein